MTCQEATRLLDALLDGELTAGDAQAVGQHLETCAECRRRLQERDELGRIVRALPYHKAPERLRIAVAAASGPRARTRATVLTWASAAVVLLSIAGAISASTWWTARVESLTADELARQHVRGLAAEPQVDVVSSDRHTVKPWFQGKLDFAPPVIDLSADGFPLVGGRIDHIDGRPVAALLYQRHLHFITVFIWPDDGRSKADTRTTRGFHERHWVQDGMTIWAVSDVNEQDLTEFARRFSSSGP